MRQHGGLHEQSTQQDVRTHPGNAVNRNVSNFRPAAAYFRNHLPTLRPLVFSRSHWQRSRGVRSGPSPLLGNDLALAPVSVNLRHEISTPHG